MNRIAKILLLTVLILALVTPASAASVTTPAIESVIDAAVGRQMEELDIPGATITVVAAGEVILRKGYGYAELESRTPVDPHRALFRTGSVAKLITWTAVMQLVEQGKLDLDTDINTYLDFSIPSRLLSGEEAAPITLRHLMTHTAGFEDTKEGLFYLSPEHLRPLGEELQNTLPARIFHPGRLTAYSTYGTALAGYIVERTSGLPFADYTEEHIFAPLSMERSTFRQPLPDALKNDMARASRYINGEYTEDDFIYVSVSPGGGMTTTSADMAQFMLAHLQSHPETQLLQPETLAQMHTTQFSPHPEVNGMTLGFIEGSYNGRRILYHCGDTFVFISGLFLVPEENIGLYVSFSGGNYFSPAAVFEAVMDQLYPAPSQTLPVPSAGAADRARNITGEYFPNRRNVTTAESLLTLTETLQVTTDSDGYLLATQFGSTSRFVETEPGIYKNTEVSLSQSPYGTFATLYFATGDNGTVTLFTDGKMSYEKAPWYATSAFTVSTLLVILLLLCTTLAIRFISFIIHRIRRQNRKLPKEEKAAALAVTAFTALTLALLLGTIASTGGISPLYGVPLSIFGLLPSWAAILDFIPYLLALTAAAIAVFAGIAWKNGSMRLLSRIHYSLLSAAALAFVLVLNTWNLL